MDKILFLIPPHITFEAFTRPAFNQKVAAKSGVVFGQPVTDMPLGVLILSAYTKRHADVETRLVDFNVLLNRMQAFEHTSFSSFFREILAREIAEFTPTIVGISALFSPNYRSLLDLADCCRELLPEAIIIGGGGVPTNMYAQIFRESTSFDALCFGEGERPLAGLLQAGDKREYLESHASWMTPAKVNRHAVPVHDFIEELDEIPFPDYGICDPSAYALNPAITAYGSLGDKQQNFHVMTSRGCPYRCCFCSSHTVHGREMRYYSVERVKQDLRQLTKDYGAKTLVFQDDHLLADRRRALEIIHFVRELGVTAVFQNGLALYALDREMLEALKGAGVHQLVLSVESGSGRVLNKIMHKPLTPNTIKRVARDCRELGIYTNVNVMIGLPGETKADIEDARQFLRTLDANWFSVLCATPLVGSEMLDICLKNDYIDGSYMDCDFKKPIVRTEEFTPEYIQETAYELNLDLNFVHNADIRLGQYETALKGFQNAIRARQDHALAYYFAGQCYGGLGDSSKEQECRAAAMKMTADSAFWQRYAKRFDVPLGGAVEEECLTRGN